MWTDSETDKDYLNFSTVSKTAAEIIMQAQSRPVSIGISGAWGVGKTSLIKQIRLELGQRVQQTDSQYIFVEFNAWLYQGYDDARAALVEVVAEALSERAEKSKKGLEKVTELLKKVDWLRAAKFVTGSSIALALGLPPIGILGQVLNLGKGLFDGGKVDDGEKEISKALDGAESTLKKATAQHSHFSPPKQIQSLRNSIEEVLKELDVTLVVLIDDLDRCLPETTISTLEAIRLFLFLQGTAFVIAADDAMIKLAVKRHFQGVDDELATNYFDKLIQVPIRVPQLGVQEVRAYMMMLFLEDSYLAPERVEQIRQKVCEQLGKSWQGKRVDLQFIRSLITDLSDELIARLDAADRLAPIMATATGIAGNPRLIKRFLNALSIRMTMSNAQGVGVDETALAKMLLFERCGDPKIFDKIIKSVAESEDGKPLFLEGFETTTEPSENADPKSSQNDPFFERWCKLPPKLSGIDLRGVLYVSREHSPLISLEDRLSPESSDILNALIDHPDMASDLTDQIRLVPPLERAIIMNKLLGKAHQEQEWGAPSILEACIIISEIDSTQGQRLAGFLKERPAVQIKPSIIPKIADRNWANTVLIGWEKDPDISRMVKSAIKQRRDRGNVKI